MSPRVEKSLPIQSLLTRFLHFSKTHQSKYRIREAKNLKESSPVNLHDSLLFRASPHHIRSFRAIHTTYGHFERVLESRNPHLLETSRRRRTYIIFFFSALAVSRKDKKMVYCNNENNKKKDMKKSIFGEGLLIIGVSLGISAFFT